MYRTVCILNTIARQPNLAVRRAQSIVKPISVAIKVLGILYG
jgi:hypothetical protein